MCIGLYVSWILKPESSLSFCRNTLTCALQQSSTRRVSQTLVAPARLETTRCSLTSPYRMSRAFPNTSTLTVAWKHEAPGSTRYTSRRHVCVTPQTLVFLYFLPRFLPSLLPLDLRSMGCRDSRQCCCPLKWTSQCMMIHKMCTHTCALSKKKKNYQALKKIVDSTLFFFKLWLKYKWFPRVLSLLFLFCFIIFLKLVLLCVLNVLQHFWPVIPQCSLAFQGLFITKRGGEGPH